MLRKLTAARGRASLAESRVPGLGPSGRWIRVSKRRLN